MQDSWGGLVVVEALGALQVEEKVPEVLAKIQSIFSVTLWLIGSHIDLITSYAYIYV